MSYTCVAKGSNFTSSTCSCQNSSISSNNCSASSNCNKPTVPCGCNKPSTCNCSPNCNLCPTVPNPCPTPQPDCTAILKAYHDAINQAQGLFDQADSLVSNDLVKAVCTALTVLTQAINLTNQGIVIEDSANATLKASGCTSGCNSNSPCCKSLMYNANEYYMVEARNLATALELLNSAACSIKSAISNNQQGDALKDQYIQCVHAAQTPNCGC